MPSGVKLSPDERHTGAALQKCVAIPVVPSGRAGGEYKKVTRFEI